MYIENHIASIKASTFCWVFLLIQRCIVPSLTLVTGHANLNLCAAGTYKVMKVWRLFVILSMKFFLISTKIYIGRVKIQILRDCHFKLSDVFKSMLPPPWPKQIFANILGSYKISKIRVSYIYSSKNYFKK